MNKEIFPRLSINRHKKEIGQIVEYKGNFFNPFKTKIYIPVYENYIDIRTTLRKKGNDGKWYLCNFHRRGNITNNFTDEQIQIFYDITISQILMEVYKFMLFGIITPNLRCTIETNDVMFELDNDQISEEDRIKHFYI